MGTEVFCIEVGAYNFTLVMVAVLGFVFGFMAALVISARKRNG